MSGSCNREKYGLAIHTSSPELGLALSNFVADSRSQTWNLGRDLSTHLHQYLAEFIKPQTWADLAFIAVAKGPGSFTSTRIGIVTARTLAQQLDIPLFGISTLAAVAWSEVGKKGSEESLLNSAIALQMPAQRGQLYTAIYQASYQASSLNCTLTPLLPDAVMTPDSWTQALDNLEMPHQLIDVPMELGTTAMSVLELADLDWQRGKRSHWSEVLPFYGQHPVEV
jgi:tRNA threonylcarbamoyl adenosine modification protein YeaZ